MQLPAPIRDAIEVMLEGQSTQLLGKTYQTVSDRYRRETAASSLQITSAEEALAYVAARMPATFGAASHVFRQVAQALPDFAPGTVLDLGAGPGTATLAALQEWDTLAYATLVEPNTHLQTISKPLLDTQGTPAEYQLASLQNARIEKRYDLVLASYVLNEIDASSFEANISKLWNVTDKTLVLIEPGTPLGYEIILKARELLLREGAHLAAPCPHAMTCPLTGSQRWCHFSARIERSSFHRRIKDNATLGYEDEKFSYLVATKLRPEPIAARILGHPHGQKIIGLELCQADGTFETVQISKRDAFYKKARKARWGDAL